MSTQKQNPAITGLIAGLVEGLDEMLDKPLGDVLSFLTGDDKPNASAEPDKAEDEAVRDALDEAVNEITYWRDRAEKAERRLEEIQSILDKE